VPVVVLGVPKPAPSDKYGNGSAFGLNRGAEPKPDRDIALGKSPAVANAMAGSKYVESRRSLGEGGQGGLRFRNEESGQMLTRY
jgi:hypothetical protein